MKKNAYFYILMIFTFALLFVGSGYALFHKTVSLNGNISLTKPGILEITSATIIRNESSNLKEYKNPTYDGLDINFSVTGTKTEFTATYLIEISNNTYLDRTINSFVFNPVVTGDEVPSITSTITYYDTGKLVYPGDVIPAYSKITVKLKLDFATGSSGTTVDVGGDVNTSVDDSGTVLAAINPKTADLREENAIACLTMDASSTYNYSRILNIISNNDNIEIVDANGVAIRSVSIGANATESYNICLKVKEDAVFINETTKDSIYVASSGIDSFLAGDITVQVPVNKEEEIVDPPVISNVKAQINSVDASSGKADIILTWDAVDNSGVAIDKYGIYVCTSKTNCTFYESTYKEKHITLSTEGNYFFKVYGHNEAGIDGYSCEKCNSCSSSTSSCQVTTSQNFKWKYNVTTSLTDLVSDGASVAYLNNQYTAKLSLKSSGNYSLPSSITVTMGGKTLTSGRNGDYTYSSSSGEIVINNVTGDIKITASASHTCLIEGTKILLSTGEYKNIEDVHYDDLIAVYDHDNGGITYTYPIWIEKEQTTDYYYKYTFSDGSVLNVASSHGVYSLESNKYISTNSPEFKIGTTIASLKDNKIVPIKLIKSEIIYATKKYYQVSSTRYHNVIAEDILTTDGMIYASNMYKYDNNLVWKADRDKLINSGDLFDYNDYSSYFEEYIFKGFRMSEAKNIYYAGLLNIEDYAKTLFYLKKEPIKNNAGNNMWMVTTSDDVVTDKSKYLYESGSYYTLKEPVNKDNFIGWLNTSDNEMYYPGDSLRIIYANHFIAQYK